MQHSLREQVNHDFEIMRRNKITPNSMPMYHFHNAYEVYYLWSGERYYFIKDKSYHIKKGDLILINEYTTHRAIASQNISYEDFLVTFKKPFLNELTKITSFNLYECFTKDVHVIHLDDEAQKMVEALLLNMLDEYKNKPTGHHFYIKTSLAQLLILAKRHAGNIPDYVDEHMSSTHKIIDEATGYINNNYGEDITLEFMSDKFFISTHYFSRIFKKLTGLTFIEYLNSVRIKEAQKLLATTNLSINEIGERVGFKSNTHFGRIFKKIADTSPSEYRKLDDI